MNSQPDLTIPPVKPDTRLGIVIRVAFFAGAVIIGLFLLTGLLYSVFNALVAGTIGLCITGLFANLLTLRVFDRRPLADIGLRATAASLSNFSLGLLLGGGAAALMLLAPLLAGSAHVVQQENSSFTWGGLFFYFFAILVAAMGEEMIFRGYVFQLLVEKMGPFATVLPMAVIFGLMHLSNPHSSFLGVLNTSLWGVILGYAFLRSHDLWLPIGLHYGWNAVLPLFGVNLSGITIDVTRYSYRWDLTPLWSGGTYGPEGGLLTTIFAIALFFAIARAPVKVQTARIAQVLNEGLLDGGF